MTTATPLFPYSLVADLSPTPAVSRKEDPRKTSKSKKSKPSQKKLPPIENVPLIATTAPDESIPTEDLNIEQTITTPSPIIPESTVTYHKVGGRSKTRKKSKKNKKVDVSPKPIKTKANKLTTVDKAEPLVFVPRKAVPFISATKDKQIDVEDDSRRERKKGKKNRKRSCKLFDKFNHLFRLNFRNF